MAGETKRVTFSEGVSTTSPTPQTTKIANLVTFATTTAFLADKGVAVEQGDMFLNSTDTHIYLYESTKWKRVDLVPVDIVTSQSTNYTATINDSVIQINTQDEPTLNLYTAVGNKGRELYVKKISSDFTSLTVQASGGETIDSSSTITLDIQNEAIRIISDNTNWLILDHYIPPIVLEARTNGSTQTMTDATFEYVDFETTVRNANFTLTNQSSGMTSTVGNAFRVTVNKAGFYNVKYYVACASSTAWDTSDQFLLILRDSSGSSYRESKEQEIQVAGLADWETSGRLSADIELAKSATLTFAVYQNTGGDLALSTGDSGVRCYMSVHFVSK